MTAHAKPVFWILLALGLLLAGTSALVRLGASDQGTQPTNQTARRAYDLLAEGFGPGFNGPIPIVVDVKSDPGAPQRVYDDVRGLQDVASVGKPQFNDAKKRGHRLRHSELGPAGRGDGEARPSPAGRRCAQGHGGRGRGRVVSGLNAAFIDIASRIQQRLPIFLLYIIGVTFIVLAMAFRSIVVSLTARSRRSSRRSSGSAS